MEEQFAESVFIDSMSRVIQLRNSRGFTPFREIKDFCIVRKATLLETLWYFHTQHWLWRNVEKCTPIIKSLSKVDEGCYDFLMDRLVRVIELYDWTKETSIEFYVYKNLQWYAYKWKTRKRKEHNIESYDAHYDHSKQQEVQQLLNDLDPTHAAFLEWKYIDGFTVEEIAEHLDRSISSVKSYLREARSVALSKYLELE